MRFRNRSEAGRSLARALERYKDRPDVLVFSFASRRSPEVAVLARRWFEEHLFKARQTLRNVRWFVVRGQSVGKA